MTNWVAPQTFIGGDPLLAAELNQIRDELLHLKELHRPYYDVTAIGNVGVGTDALMSYVLPVATMSEDGQVLRFSAGGTFGTNANAKSINFTWGGGATIGVVVTVTTNGGGWKIRGEVLRTGAATQLVTISASSQAAAGTQTNGYANTVARTEALSGAVTMAFFGIGTADDDVRQTYLLVWPVG